MSRGNVKWFNSEKGYGFISQRDGTDLFVHVSQVGTLGRRLDAGQSVEFDLDPVTRGPQALHVRTV
jgi:CspA family cold shock protein